MSYLKSAERVTNKGVASGYAALDSGILVPVAQLPGMVASGGSHRAGIVPDPGSSAGTNKYLREDATWQIPSGNVLASVSLTAQTAAIGSTTLYTTPATGGLFTIEAYICVSTTGSSGNLSLDIQWIDDSSVTQTATITRGIISVGGAYSTIISQCISSASQNILYDTTFSGTPGSVHYSVYIRVRQI
jgi:hypothetical protein